MRLWLYYYFLARKEGAKPGQDARWAKRWCIWWDAKDYDVDVGRAPLDWK